MAEGDPHLKRQRSISVSPDDVDPERPNKKQALSTSSASPDRLSASSSSSRMESLSEERPDLSSEVLDALEAELSCACCAGLLHRPALLQPCNHAFCASCVVSWVRNGGTACPTCRSPSDSIHSARFLQNMIDLLVRFRPEAARSLKEKQEADVIWLPGQLLPLPPARPRHQSPPPMPLNLARPCPHCTRNNHFGYVCPIPIPDPAQVPREQAWDLESHGPPHGHGFCSGCDELYALGAPTGMSCSFCKSKYCGYSVVATCVLPKVTRPQMPRHMDTVAKLLECDELYEAFCHNSIEVDLLIDYLHSRQGGVNGVLRNIIEWVRCQPGGFNILNFLAMEGPIGDQSRHNGHDDDDSDRDSDSEDEDGEPEIEPIPNEHPAPPSDDDLHQPPAPAMATNANDMSIPPIDSVLPPQNPEIAHVEGPGSDMEVDPPTGVLIQPPPASDVPAPMPPQAEMPPQPPVYFTRICRDCSEQVFIWGIYDWWVRERSLVEAAIPATVRAKKDCVNGRRCDHQGSASHSREFNHICDPAPPSSNPEHALPPVPDAEDPLPLPIEALPPPVHFPPMPSSDPAEQLIEDMLLHPNAPSLALPILQAQGDINMDDEAEVERQMEQYLNLEIGVTAAV
ncbi:hypothetical protein DACRYDRAFT_118588 [Dacryopinax primogenitus]|uniref:RING-type domain-containing protein n=1 Tax=Dacryopinax primogenitus (strain DJM 731) TaxID=1858805 RepID=M5FZ23_DACPD|nr:uncharacterized protein DACRYDRAFT_118588 [Dacryopinax primogenitus]EJT98826.1 hypothetical protein DACRYDRAFT_118588 [Dacryopinax primogenitus]